MGFHYQPSMRSKLKALLIEHEGNVPYAYQDHLGYWTIGVGRLIDHRRNGGLSEAEIDYLLENDIDNVVTQLEHTISYWDDLSDSVKVALASMAFKMGVAGLFGFSRILGLNADNNWKYAI